MQTGRADGAKVFAMGGAAAASEEAVRRSSNSKRTWHRSRRIGRSSRRLDGDTIAQDQELAVAFERFKASGANTLMVYGTPSAEIRGAGAAGLTGEIGIWSNDSGGLANLGATIADKSIADGALVSTGPTDTEIWENARRSRNAVRRSRSWPGIPDHDLRDPLSYAADEDNWFNPAAPLLPSRSRSSSRSPPQPVSI